MKSMHDGAMAMLELVAQLINALEQRLARRARLRTRRLLAARRHETKVWFLEARLEPITSAIITVTASPYRFLKYGSGGHPRTLSEVM